MFEVGDSVKAFGVSGVVTEVTDERFALYCVHVVFGEDKNRTMDFTLDGRIAVWAKECSLSHV